MGGFWHDEVQRSFPSNIPIARAVNTKSAKATINGLLRGGSLLSQKLVSAYYMSEIAV